MMRCGALVIGLAALGLVGCGQGDLVDRVTTDSTRPLSDCELERSRLATRRGTYGESLRRPIQQMWTVIVKGQRLTLIETYAGTGDRCIHRLQARGPKPTDRYQLVWEGSGPPGSGSVWADVTSVPLRAIVIVGYQNRLELLQVAQVSSGLYVSEPTEILTTESQIVGVRLQRSEDRLHLAWAEETSCLDIFDSRLFYAHADLNGEHWSEPRCLSETAVISTINLVADDGDVFVGWSDHRFRQGDFEYPENEAKAFVARSRDDGETFERPRMLNEPFRNEDNAALLYLAPAGDDLVVFWAQRREGIVENSWQHGLLDRDLTTLQVWGPISGQEMADAYHQRMRGRLQGTATALPESPWAD